MHIAVVLTMFVSLTLVGAGFLLWKQAQLTEEYYGNELQIAAVLCRDGDTTQPSCAGAANETQIAAIQDVVDDSPEVETSRFETKEEAFEKLKELYDPAYFEGPNAAMTAEDMPARIWITLKDPEEYDGVTSAIQGLDGVSSVEDQRELVEPVFNILDTLRNGSVLTAGFLVIAALLLVANTIRLAAFARRKEIGIMRLVGASTIYITLPFLLEALVVAAVSVVLAGGAIAALMYFGVEGQLADSLTFLPWVDWAEFGQAAVVVAVLGPVLTLLPTLLLTRKYIKV
jgi:cell division transport system permease protein